MSLVSYPFDDSNVLENEFSYMARLYAPTGVVGNAGDTNLQVFADSSGMAVKVRTGQAVLLGFYCRNTATASVAIDSNSSGNPRIDTVILKLDTTANSVVLAIKKGTESSSPVPATLTQLDAGTFELPLAYVRVESGAASISADKVTDHRQYQVDPKCPPGTSLAYDGAALPPGFLWRDGSSVSRAAYWQLGEALGFNADNDHGSGDGVTTYNLPDSRGRVMVGRDPSSSLFNKVGKKFGTLTEILTLGQIPGHTHTDPVHTHTGVTNSLTSENGITGSLSGRFSNEDSGQDTGTIRRGQTGDSSVRAMNNTSHGHGLAIDAAGGGQTGSAGGGGSHNNVQPSITCGWIIKT